MNSEQTTVSPTHLLWKVAGWLIAVYTAAIALATGYSAVRGLSSATTLTGNLIQLAPLVIATYLVLVKRHVAGAILAAVFFGGLVLLNLSVLIANGGPLTWAIPGLNLFFGWNETFAHYGWSLGLLWVIFSSFAQLGLGIGAALGIVAWRRPQPEPSVS